MNTPEQPETPDSSSLQTASGQLSEVPAGVEIVATRMTRHALTQELLACVTAEQVRQQVARLHALVMDGKPSESVAAFKALWSIAGAQQDGGGGGGSGGGSSHRYRFTVDVPPELAEARGIKRVAANVR